MQKKKSKRKTAIAKPKAKPEIFVKIGRDRWGYEYIYAKAHIRIKGGEYQYLEWWDGTSPRSLYLGRKRKP